MTRDWVKRHRRIKDFLDNNEKYAVAVKEVSEKIGSDPRTVKAHFQVMSIDSCGKLVGGDTFIKTGFVEGEKLIEDLETVLKKWKT